MGANRTFARCSATTANGIATARPILASVRQRVEPQHRRAHGPADDHLVDLLEDRLHAEADRERDAVGEKLAGNRRVHAHPEGQGSPSEHERAGGDRARQLADDEAHRTRAGHGQRHRHDTAGDDAGEVR